jgi:D-3-phosphoglycerate dehydrogenase
MTKVLVVTEKPFASEAVDQIKAIISDAGYEFALLEKYTEKQSFLDAVETADAIIIRSDKVDEEVLKAAKNLKIVVRAGAGFDNVDLIAATSHGVVVMNTPGQNSNAVAELTIGMMVYQARNKYNGKSGRELKDKKLGIHAFGNVGKRVAAIAKGFGMHVYAFDPYIPRDVIESAGVQWVSSAEELYSQCHYVSLNIPATTETRNSINFELLTKMPRPATLVNTARKEVVNEIDLVKVYEARPDFVYIADVAPDCSSEIIDKFADRAFFTPKKMGAQTEEANINAGIAAASQIVSFIENGDRTFQVNK